MNGTFQAVVMRKVLTPSTRNFVEAFNSGNLSLQRVNDAKDAVSYDRPCAYRKQKGDDINS